jgi:hypothetical protein
VGLVRLEAVTVHWAMMADLDHPTPLAEPVVVGLAVMAVMADVAVMADIAEVLRTREEAAVVMLDLGMTSIIIQTAPAIVT